MEIFNFIGIIGTITTILAYLFSSFGLLKVGVLYQVMNMVGSLFLVISLTSHFNMPALVLETVWCLISVVALIRILVIGSKNLEVKA